MRSFMNKKNMIILLFVLFIIVFSITTVIVYNKNKKIDMENEIKLSDLEDDKITDECTDEYEALHLEDVTETNSSQVKVSPNCELILSKFYDKCEHTISENVELPQELINMTKDDLEEYFKDWKVEEFSSNKIVLYKRCEGQCDEHFLLKNIDGKIVIFKLNDNGDEDKYQDTDISTEYLTDTDLINMQDGGLQIFGKEQLNKVIEDFE